MNKEQLTEAMTHYVPLTRDQAWDAVSALECAVFDSCTRGVPVAINGFGMFELQTKENGDRFLAFRQALSLKKELNQEKPSLNGSVDQAAT